MPASHGSEEGEKLVLNWTNRLGDKAYFPDYVSFFSHELSRLGRVGVLNKYFVELIPALWTAAFHCLIHTGFALFANHDESLSRGLAYFSSSFRILDPNIDSIQVDNVVEADIWTVLGDICLEDEVWKVVSKTRGFQNRLHFLAQHDSLLQSLTSHFARIKAGFAKIGSTQELTQILGQSTFKLFFSCGSNDFFLLHAITAFHALKPILLYLKEERDRRLALLHFTFALLATYIVRDRPTIDASRQPVSLFSSPPTPTHIQEQWAYIMEKAIRYEDEHVIKLVYVAKWNFDQEELQEMDDDQAKLLYLATAKETIDKVQNDGCGWRF